MNFLRKHTTTKTIPISFPSLFTTSSSMDQESTTGNDAVNDDENDRDLDDPKMAYATFQQRVTRYIHNAYSLERSSSDSSTNIYHSRIDGTVSTSLVEDTLSLVNAMAMVLHTYLIDIAAAKKKKEKMNSESVAHTPMSTNDKVLMFISGIQHIITTLEHNQCERSKQMMLWYTHENNAIETICAAMNDCVRLSESIEMFISDTIPNMIQAIRQQEVQQQQRLNHQAVATITESRNDATCRNPSLTVKAETMVTQQIANDAYIALQQSVNDLIALFSNHAVLLSEQISMFLIRNIKIHSTIMTDFFSPSWENEWTSNELCRSMIHLYIHKYLLQCQTYLVGTNHSNGTNHHTMIDNSEDELRHQDRDTTKLYLFHKVIINTVRATICLYIRCLIQNKAEPIALERKDNHNNGIATIIRNNAGNRNSTGSHPHSHYFQNPQRALRRMYDDIRILQKYFIKQFCRDHVTLQRIIVDEFSTLELLHECLLCCCNEHLQVSNGSITPTTTTASTSSSSSSSLESFIVVIHKRCTNGNALITRYLVGDLYVLMSPPSLSKPRFRFLHHMNNNNSNNEMYQQRITSIQNALQQLQPDLLLVTSRMKELNDQQISEHVPKGTNYKNSDAYIVSSFLQLNCMLQSLYEERMTQGILPVLCHSFCILPHFDNDDEVDDYDGTNPKEVIAELFIHPIRTITRTLRR